MPTHSFVFDSRCFHMLQIDKIVSQFLLATSLALLIIGAVAFGLAYLIDYIDRRNKKNDKPRND